MLTLAFTATALASVCLGPRAASQTEMAVTSVSAIQDVLGPIAVGAACQIVIRIDITTTRYDPPIHVTTFDLSNRSIGSDKFTGRSKPWSLMDRRSWKYLVFRGRWLCPISFDGQADGPRELSHVR